MDTSIADLLLDTVSINGDHPEKWYDDIFTQGNSLVRDLTNISEKKDTTNDNNNNNNINLVFEETTSKTISDTNTDTNNHTSSTEQKYHKKPRESTISFIDAFASNIDDMFHIYSYETKRDIRQYIKNQLIDWVSKHARVFFGPSTSRSISTCLRSRGLAISMTDIEKFAEMVSFFLEQPIQVGSKVIVWHGFQSSSRDPICELILKQQGVFVKQIKN